MRTRISKLIVVLSLLAGALAFGTAASADNTNPNGAQVVNITNQCSPDPYTGNNTMCISEHGVFQNVYGDPNAAGNSSVTVNGRECITETDSTGAVVLQVCQNNFHEHLLFKDGTPQEGHISFTDTRTTPAGTFCITQNYHYANGQVQYGSITPTPGAC